MTDSKSHSWPGSYLHHSSRGGVAITLVHFHGVLTRSILPEQYLSNAMVFCFLFFLAAFLRLAELERYMACAQEAAQQVLYDVSKIQDPVVRQQVCRRVLR